MKGQAKHGTQGAEIEQHRRAIRANPRNAQAHALLGLALQQLGRLEEAVASQRRALELDPKLTGLHTVLAPTLYVLGQHKAAADSYRHALRAEPQSADLHKGFGDALRALGQFSAAQESARRAVALAPDNPENHLGLAAAQYAAGDYEGAASSFRNVLDRAPENLAARVDLGQALVRSRQWEAGAACYREVLERTPDHFGAHVGLAECLRSLKQFDAAVASYQRALEIVPDNAAALHDLGMTLHQRGRRAEASDLFQRALEIEPDNTLFLASRALNCFERGEWEQTLQFNRRMLGNGPRSPESHSASLFMLSHCCNDPAELTAEHLKFGERWEAPGRAQWAPHANQRDPGRQLRVGFVSADLYNHAVAMFMAPVFERLRQSTQLTLHVYYNNELEDDITRQLRGYIAHWHPIAGLDDEAVERQIRADGIDILVDLSGHSARNRLPLFARKPAPVQASWIGYAGTTGLQAMDYYLSDQFALPDGRYDDQFTEQIVRLPLGALFAADPTAPPVSPLPALTNGYLTFGSFHRANKLSRRVIALWAQLLRGVPDAKMLLGGLRDGDEDTLLNWFDGEGIDRSRLILRQRTSIHEYQKQHHEVDICLSPFPYTGSTTLLHALWMGVPTLTTVGPTNPSHAIASALVHMGLSSFIADDEAAYVMLGGFLSQNLPVLAQLRAGMRERFASSLLGYPGLASAGLEHALRQMWQRWCAGLPPAPFKVRLSDLALDGEPETAA
jgi:predicted O-linked N-acetylglucosamine transferase (SPINDLY family)